MLTVWEICTDTLVIWPQVYGFMPTDIFFQTVATKFIHSCTECLCVLEHTGTKKAQTCSSKTVHRVSSMNTRCVGRTWVFGTNTWPQHHWTPFGWASQELKRLMSLMLFYLNKHKSPTSCGKISQKSGACYISKGGINVWWNRPQVHKNVMFKYPHTFGHIVYSEIMILVELINTQEQFQSLEYWDLV